jgi:CRISPR system Cascade subunit CasE
MTFLSRVQLNSARRGAIKLLGDSQAMHAAVRASFSQPDEERGRVLWRVDRDSHQTWLYVVSGPKPDFVHIVEQAGWPTTQEGWAVRAYEPLLSSLAVGQQWAFRLTANPTHAVRGSQGRVSKRYAHVTVEQQRTWLLQRATELGFEVPESDGVPDLVVHNRYVERFRRRAEGSRPVTVSKATFDGQLRVVDPVALRNALVNGVGRAKAYGCGLLTLAPLA